MGFSPPQSKLEGQSWKGAKKSGAAALSCAYPAYVKCVLCSAYLLSDPRLCIISLLNSCLSSTSVLWGWGSRLCGHICIRKISIKS